MESRLAERLRLLRSKCVPKSFLADQFGTEWPPQGDFALDFAGWLQARGRRQLCTEPEESRWLAEAFLQDHRTQALPWAAARLGMKRESLTELLAALPRLGLRRNYELYPGIIDETLSEDLIRSLRGLRLRTFGTHDGFCQLLHEAIRDLVGINIKPEYCATSIEMDEYPKLFAYHLDSISLKPLSVRHSVWLDLGKPFSLAPDRCSKLLYAENRDELKGLLAGSGEPDGIHLYEDFLCEAGRLSSGEK
jgi:hypothetical protein